MLLEGGYTLDGTTGGIRRSAVPLLAFLRPAVTGGWKFLGFRYGNRDV